jgi:hypothetical protein
LHKFEIELIKADFSKLELEVLNFLKSIYSGSIMTNDRKILDGKEIDIFLPDLNLGIECNGAYWHSELSGRDKNYHRDKLAKCKDRGVILFNVWDFLWHSKGDIIKSMLNTRLYRNTRIHARKCELTYINTELERLFLEKNHIQGYSPSTVCLGLVYDNEVVQIMSFGKSRYSKNVNTELIRLCTKAGLSVIGGASRLFSKFIETNNEPIISYSSAEYFSGNVYKQIGFKYSHSTNPAYYYTKDYAKFENRVKYQKHKLNRLLEKFDPGLTEWQNMQANGYDRVWDCGNDVWIYNV